MINAYVSRSCNIASVYTAWGHMAYLDRTDQSASGSTQTQTSCLWSTSTCYDTPTHPKYIPGSGGSIQRSKIGQSVTAATQTSQITCVSHVGQEPVAFCSMKDLCKPSCGLLTGVACIYVTPSVIR